MAEHAVQNDPDALFGRGPAQLGKVLVGAQQRVGLEVVGGVVAVVGVGFKDRVEVDAAHPEAFQVGQLLPDADKIPPEVVHVQVAFRLLGGPEIGLAGLVGPVDPVGKGHGFARVALIEAVGEDLVHRAVFDPVRRLEIRLIDRQLPAVLQHPGEFALPARAPADLAEVGVQVEIIEIQPGGGGPHGDRKVVGAVLLAVKLHAVVYRVLPVFGQDQVRVHIPVVHRHIQMQGDRRVGGHGAEWRFVARQAAVEKGIRHSYVCPFGLKSSAAKTAASAAGARGAASGRFAAQAAKRRRSAETAQNQADEPGGRGGDLVVSAAAANASLRTRQRADQGLRRSGS